MTRTEIYKLIDTHRDKQDEVWRTGRKNEGQYKFAAPHILLIEENALKLRQLWYVSKKEDLTDRLAIVASLAVRALEEIESDE